jgi:hypothetical protein
MHSGAIKFIFCSYEDFEPVGRNKLELDIISESSNNLFWEWPQKEFIGKYPYIWVAAAAAELRRTLLGGQQTLDDADSMIDVIVEEQLRGATLDDEREICRILFKDYIRNAFP